MILFHFLTQVVILITTVTLSTSLLNKQTYSSFGYSTHHHSEDFRSCETVIKHDFHQNMLIIIIMYQCPDISRQQHEQSMIVVHFPYIFRKKTYGLYFQLIYCICQSILKVVSNPSNPCIIQNHNLIFSQRIRKLSRKSHKGLEIWVLTDSEKEKLKMHSCLYLLLKLDGSCRMMPMRLPMRQDTS